MMKSLSNLISKRPLLGNSVIYGIFYTGAEFVQQSYNKKFQVDNVKHSLSVSSVTNTNCPPNWLYKLNESFGFVQDPNKIGEFDWIQLQRYGIYGCLLAGPILHGWYKWLDSYYIGITKTIILKKLFADQFILTPLLIILFFSSMSLMEGRDDILHECKFKFAKTFQTSCIYWIPLQFVNFLLIPPALRVAYVSVAAFCWVNILCYLKRTPLLPEQDNKGK
ncbi:PXMP2/4 family protein 4 [Cephus cinctus]|uniref:PXMP2/4 family protein 4 n=1 Tax=Cephus cinctus TaxID=211228 RepID=A0AAJ7FCH6_CEPCN|nr:PXMP2/4 family protein 4 [Cephus cinctus]XP_015585035.1 PXMP2/4 family protein 4 [Cephus cinctus]XP_015585036.1 PXMP2/4 family protein 4 [Cephus cinctus]XP_024936034.1 PXMP2/4 family protein 4 [Cephus cinctus]